MDAKPHDLDALLAHAGWARALARHLARDQHAADDLLQRTWLAALRRPPGDGASPRRWLAAVMRNLASDHARESSRRAARERVVARDERVDPVGDAVAAHAHLVAAVDALPEPYRAAIWARYYEGHAPRAIAARDGVPIETVKSRLVRGLELLRRRFDREHGGDRGAWVALFLPLAQPEPFSTTAIGAFLMGTKVKAAVAAAVVGVAATWFALAHDPVEPTSTNAATSASIELDGGEADDAERALAIDTESESVARVPATRALDVEPPGGDAGNVHVPPVRGRVLDVDGQPVEGLEIVPAKHGWPSDVRSAADGSFEVAREFAGHALEARGEGWATVWVDRIPRVGADHRVTIVVAPAGRLSGSVVDDEGRPVEDAAVELRIDDGMRRSLAALVEAEPHRLGYTAVSDAEGRFDLGSVPLVAGSILADVDGRNTRAVAVPDRARDDLVLALAPPGVDDIVVRGTVRSGPTHFVSGAYVRVGAATQRTSAEGAFRLVVRPSDLRDEEGPIELVAVSENLSPTSLSFTSRVDLAQRAATEKFDLLLSVDPLLDISGRVVDSDGNPVVGARVRASEDAFGNVTVGRGDRLRRNQRTVQAILRGDRGPDVAPTGGAGGFTIDGLRQRDYRIVITSTELLAMTVLESVPAGTEDLVIALDTRGPRRRVAGRVVDESGRPVVGASVTAELDLGFAPNLLTSSAVATNGDGVFELTGLRGRIVEVHASVEGFAAVAEVTRETALDDVRLVLPRMHALQVDLRSKPGLATDFEVHDARGRVGLHRSSSVASATVETVSNEIAGGMPLVDGRSDIVNVDAGELTLVLLRSGVEVARIPLVFASEGVTIVRP